MISCEDEPAIGEEPYEDLNTEDEYIEVDPKNLT